MTVPALARTSTSTRPLLLANGITLVVALIFNWSPAWLLWPYWIQSVIIGWYARKRMLNLVYFSTEGFTSNGQPVPENETGKRSTTTFFVLHYGGFHAAYLMYLLIEHRVSELWDILALLACGVSFVLSQRQTYAAQHAADLRGKPNLGRLMFTPYLRVLPMHLGIIFGGGSNGGAWMLVLFTVLKTLSDIALDTLDRRFAIQAAPATAAPVATEE